MRSKFFIAIALVASILGILSMSTLFSCSTSGGKHGDLTYAVDSMMTGLFPAGSPGAVVVISKGDSVIYSHGFGIADLDKGTPLTDSTLMCIASSTKTFTAIALLKLQDQGRLSLDDKLVDYFPEFPDSIFGQITLRHILSQSSGIPDNRPVTDDEWKEYIATTPSIFVNGADYRKYGAEEEFARYLTNLRGLEFEPGTAFERSDPPFMLMYKVIESASGKPFARFMQEEVFDPAGLTHARFVSADGKLPANMAHAYRHSDPVKRPDAKTSEDGRWEEYDYGEVNFYLSRADRGIYLTPRELAHWQHVFASGTLISPEATALFGTPVVNDGGIDGEGFSLGLNVGHDNAGNVKYYHRSNRGGFCAVECYFPEYDLAYIVLANRGGWNMVDVAKSLDGILLRLGYLHRK